MFAEALEALCIVVFGLVSDYFLFLSQADCNCRAPPTHSGSCVLPSRVGDTATKASEGVVFELALAPLRLVSCARMSDWQLKTHCMYLDWQ